MEISFPSTLACGSSDNSSSCGWMSEVGSSFTTSSSVDKSDSVSAASESLNTTVSVSAPSDSGKRTDSAEPVVPSSSSKVSAFRSVRSGNWNGLRVSDSVSAGLSSGIVTTGIGSGVDDESSQTATITTSNPTRPITPVLNTGPVKLIEPTDSSVTPRISAEGMGTSLPASNCWTTRSPSSLTSLA